MKKYGNQGKEGGDVEELKRSAAQTGSEEYTSFCLR